MRSILAIANALPALPRGIFVEGWSADEVPDPPVSAGAFHARVVKALESHHTPPATIVGDVFAVGASTLASVSASGSPARFRKPSGRYGRHDPDTVGGRAQAIVVIRPPSTRTAAPLTAAASGLAR
jgi:hypothetical protein